jgi:hypothetical protein
MTHPARGVAPVHYGQGTDAMLHTHAPASRPNGPLFTGSDDVLKNGVGLDARPSFATFDDALDRIYSLSDADLLQAFHRFVDLEAAACERCERTHSYAGSDNGLHAQNQRDRQAALRLREACAAELMTRRLHA